MKVLCFTTSYNRPYHIYNTINNIINQSYKDIVYSVNINYVNEQQKKSYYELLKDFSSVDNIKIHYNHKQSQHDNYLNAIKLCDDNYDIFIKIDDDDIYHKKYIEKAIEYYLNNNTDILSFTSNKHINNNYIYDEIKEIGHWVGDNHDIQFGMPSTYVFNRNALNSIINLSNNDVQKIFVYEDAAWRKAWRDDKLKSTIISENNLFTYHIHDNNISSTFLLKDNPDEINYDGISTEHCDIYYFKHKSWSSYMILNKRNNRVYNIKNDDHGKFIIKGQKILIRWDNYGSEWFECKSNKLYEQI